MDWEQISFIALFPGISTPSTIIHGHMSRIKLKAWGQYIGKQITEVDFSAILLCYPIVYSLAFLK